MMKMTLSILLLIMKYQGNKGKYYTIQKVSILISAISSLLFTGIFKQFTKTTNRDLIFILHIIIWVLTFIVHYSWFLNKKKENTYIHYREYKRYLAFFILIIIFGFILNM